jgi:hypothetical protein
MGKVYQNIVIEQVENLILGLKEADFFEEYEIKDLTFVRQHLLDILTSKFIDGTLEEPEMMFSEDEFNTLLQELVAGSILYELKDKGYVNSYEDDNTEEMFFLTKKGKKYLKNDKLED